MNAAGHGLDSHCSQNRGVVRDRMGFESHNPLHRGFLCRTARSECLNRLVSVGYLNGCYRFGPEDRSRFARRDIHALRRVLSSRKDHVVRNCLAAPYRVGHTALRVGCPEQNVRLGLLAHTVTNRYSSRFERWNDFLYDSIGCMAWWMTRIGLTTIAGKAADRSPEVLDRYIHCRLIPDHWRCIHNCYPGPDVMLDIGSSERVPNLTDPPWPPPCPCCPPRKFVAIPTRPDCPWLPDC